MNLSSYVLRRKHKLANQFADFRHEVLEYPVVEITDFRGRMFEAAPTASPIPRVIVQTYRTRRVVQPIQSAVTRWQESNPEFDYQFFDDETSRAFIEDHYPADVLAAYDALIPGAFKADLWRYCYLAEKGGVYVDIRMEPVLALRTILSLAADEPPAFVSVRDRHHTGGGIGHAFLYNALIAATPGHPFVIAALERTVANVRDRDYGRDSLDISGPGCFGAAINVLLRRPIDTPFAVGDQVDETVGRYRILDHGYDSYHREVVLLGDRVAAITKCIHGPMLQADSKYSKSNYVDCYNNRQVFFQ
jgi:hypothetical protein